MTRSLRPWTLLALLLAASLWALGCPEDDDDATDDDTGDDDTGDDDTGDDDTGDDDTGDDDTADDDTGDDDTMDYWDLYDHVDDGIMKGCSGEDIAYHTWTPNSEKATANLVFLNGRGEFLEKYHFMINYFHGRPWNIIYMDHYGQGESGGVRAHCPDLDDVWVCDVDAVVTALADPKLPTVVMAHSMGGFIATKYALAHPDDLVALCLSSPMYGLDVKGAGLTYEKAIGLCEIYVDAGQADQPSMFNTGTAAKTCKDNVATHDCGLWEEWHDDPLGEIGNPTWGWLHEVLVEQQDLWSEASTLTTPTLLHQAGDEHYVDPAKHNEVCDAANAVTPGVCTIEPWKGLYHELFREIERGQIIGMCMTHFETELAAK